MVRLEVQSLQWKRLFLAYFNSCMVRLEDVDTLAKKITISKFQFLYGTIGSSNWSSCFIISFISIPVWYDWKFSKQKRSASLRSISIPVWYDWKLNKELISFNSKCISIPVWYDWKQSIQLNIIFPLLYFNSCMVRLEVQRKTKP